jgi:hypothetical protein
VVPFLGGFGARDVLRSVEFFSDGFGWDEQPDQFGHG